MPSHDLDRPSASTICSAPDSALQSRFRAVLPRWLAWVVPAAMLATGMHFAHGAPSTAPQPLSAVLAAVENKGVTPICDVSFDDGIWEIEGYHGEAPVELHVHPVYLSVIAEHPESPQAKPTREALSARMIATRLEQDGFTRIHELEWKGGRWHAEVVGDQGPRDLTIEPTTGKILSNQPED